MKEKINIAAILESKPQGTKLYSLTYGDCSYQGYTGDFGIECQSQNGVQFNLDEYGKYCIEGECILFPSKEMRDWSKFAWKKGDILVSNDGKTNVIFNKWEDDTYVSFYGRHYLNNENGDNPLYYRTFVCTTEMYSIVNKDIAKDYISSIEEKFGGKLNLKTLEINKSQLEFKDGDIVAVDLDRKNIRIFKEKTNENNFIWGNYYIGFSFNSGGKIIQTFENYKADCISDHLATEEEKQQLFDALAKVGKRWNAEKKVVEDIKTEYQFKPFERVLVRDNRNEAWRAAFFSYINEYKRYVTTSMAWKYCVPYEGNEHLLGTTKDAKE